MRTLRTGGGLQALKLAAMQDWCQVNHGHVRTIP
jgi:hypothetical protein